MADVTAKQAALRCAEICEKEHALWGDSLAEDAHAGRTAAWNCVLELRAYAATLPDDEGTVRVPVAWIATGPSGRVLHFSVYDGWQVTEVPAAAKEGA